MRSTEAYSLQQRLLTGLLSLLALLAVGLVGLVVVYANRASERAFDRLLLGSVLSVADGVRVEDGRTTADLPYAAIAGLAAGGRDRIFYRISDPAGRLITGYPDLAPGLPLAASDRPRFFDGSFRDAKIRSVVLGRLVAAGESPGWVTLVVAQSDDERAALRREIFWRAVTPIVLLVAVGAGLIWFGVRRALAPLAQLDRLVRARGPTDLEPIAAPAPAEVGVLLGSLNLFMARLQGSLRAMQSLLADAAHQIRTPLASLRAQAELAADEDDPDRLRERVDRIRRSAAMAGQLANQLLTHAMVTHRHEVPRRDAVDLEVLVRQVVQRAEAGADDVLIRLDLGEPGVGAHVAGDRITLTEAVANLVDNALKYAGAAGPVDLSLSRPAPDQIWLEVADRGPGIPDADKARVLERFTRCGSAEGVLGSGLGLAIVKAVADAHAGELVLLDRSGGGLRVRLVFQAAEPPHRRRMVVAALAGLLGLVATSGALRAQAPELFPAPAAEAGRLVIWAVTDRPIMAALIADFQALNPDVTVEFLELGSLELYARVVEPDAPPVADLLISSAVDLQVKLVNDGYARPHISSATRALPAWANWRDEAFGFSCEPVVIVHNVDRLPASRVPRSRTDLIRLLQAEAERLHRAVATYDIAASGVGYLFATQDSVLSGQFWRLATALGNAGVRLFPTTAEVLDLVERGDVLLGYNVLGSYARQRQREGAPLGVVLPEDYTLVMPRVAVIPEQATSPALAARFVDHLLSPGGQAAVARATGAPALLPPDGCVGGPGRAPADAAGPVQPIALSPALLVYLDPLKRTRFLTDWSLATQPP